MKTWADNAENRSPLEHFATFEAAKARFEELRGEGYNSEVIGPDSDGRLPARLTLGLESADGMSAADILHVRQGQNYLVTDFTKMERLRDDPAAMDLLARVSREIGFDCVRVFEQADSGRQIMSTVPFAEWDNPYFPSSAPGGIAAQYYSFLHKCYPLPEDGALRAGQITEVVQYLRREGRNGADQLSRAVAGLAAGLPDDPAVQESAKALIGELARYDEPGQTNVPRQKSQHRKSQER